MKSGISLFDRGLSKNLLRRFWPLWTCYLAAVMFALPVTLYSDQSRYMRYSQSQSELLSLMSRAVLNCGQSMIYLSFAVGAIGAMAMFGFMYSTRGSGLMCSLPLRREKVFSTAYLTGLLPMLAADALAFGVAAALMLPGGLVELRYLLLWLAIALMCNIFFYSFGVFCAMLTGNMAVLPLVYVTLNLAAWVVEGCLRYLTSIFVYGMAVREHFFDFLAPLVTLQSELGYTVDSLSGAVEPAGMGCLGVYCALGLLLTAAAFLLYKKRRMETATDVVAIPILKPVFKYCMTLGCGAVFAYLTCSLLSDVRVYGLAAALLVLALLLAGAFIGYFASEMLMQKTVRVFSGKWRGYIISCCAIALFVLCFEMDIFGFERHMPELGQIESVYLTDGADYKEPENIRLVSELHRQIIENKEQNQRAEETRRIEIDYSLKNGDRLRRSYYVDISHEANYSADSDIAVFQRLINLQEAIQKRYSSSVAVKQENVITFSIDSYGYSEDGEFVSDYISLSEAQAVDFYENCLLPDMAEGKMGRIWAVYNDEYYDTVTNISIYLELLDRDKYPTGQSRNAPREGFSFTLSLDAERCLSWIEANTELEIKPLRLADPPEMGKDGAYIYEDTASYYPYG